MDFSTKFKGGDWKEPSACAPARVHWYPLWSHN